MGNRIPFKKTILEINPKPVDDKIKTISNYKFSLCFENTSFPGFITEKIIDCFKAGTIPIYLGTPDITKFIPADTFIDMRKFKSMEKLLSFLLQIHYRYALELISNGRKFLKSPEGKLFSYESNAKFVLELTLKSNLTNHLLRNKNPD